MKEHLPIVAYLNIAVGALYLLGALAIFFFMTAAGAIVLGAADHDAATAAGIVGLVGVVISCFLAILGLPSIIGGWALLKNKSWARPLCIVLAILHLPNVPFGTALGVYTLWVLFSRETPAAIAPGGLQPTV